MQIEIISHISTPRLDLRLLSVDHAPLSVEARIESFAHLKKWDIFAPEPSADIITLADEVKMCAWRIERIQQRESLFYSLFRREDKRFLGTVSLTKCDWNTKKAMLGFWLRVSETGKGYATEAAKALVTYGLSDLGLNLYSMHASGNHNSQAVLLKVGFQCVGIDEACHHLPGGHVVDEVHYELKGHEERCCGGLSSGSCIRLTPTTMPATII
jgi:RimJ/RimL family protein N-acetyltransferase